MDGWPPYSLGSQAGVVVTNHSISTWLEGFSQFSSMGTSNKGVILQTNVYSVWEDFYVKMWDYAFLNGILRNRSFFLRLTGENLLKSSLTKLTLLFQADRFIMGKVVTSVSNTALYFWRLEVLEIIGKISPMWTAGPSHWSLRLLPDHWLFSIYSFITIYLLSFNRTYHVFFYSLLFVAQDSKYYRRYSNTQVSIVTLP